MAIACCFLTPPNLMSDPPPPPPPKIKYNMVSVKNCNLWGGNKRGFFPLAAAMDEASTSCCPDVEYLEREFRVPGVTFSGIGDSCVVGMTVDNGSAAKLMLPSGLITSFKAQMWHGGTMELLHTSVSARDKNTGGGAAVIQGGLSLALGCDGGGGGVSWSPNAWALHQVNGTPQESIQVQLISRNEQINAQVKHIITIERDLLTSEILVTNSSTSSLRLMGSVICHLALSTPDATYAVGLQGSDFYIRPPFVTNFSIIPPNFGRTDQDPSKFWGFNKLWNARNFNVEDDVEKLQRDTEQELEGEEEEEDNYKHLTEKLSRIYTSAPRSLTIIDRGRRNSVTVRRNGFKEVYMLSPGSEHEWYNKYSYICIGHAALLESIILNPQTEWRGGLQLLNPNS